MYKNSFLVNFFILHIYTCKNLSSDKIELLVKSYFSQYKGLRWLIHLKLFLKSAENDLNLKHSMKHKMYILSQIGKKKKKYFLSQIRFSKTLVTTWYEQKPQVDFNSGSAVQKP